MRYNLIFYMSKRTGYCERRLRKMLNKIDAEPYCISGATTPTELGEEVSRSLRTVNLTVIIGGLGSLDDDNLATVLSRVFSNTILTLENMRRLTAGGSDDGYVIRYKTQVILALPDSPDAIEAMLDDKLLTYLSEKTAPQADPDPQAATEPEAQTATDPQAATVPDPREATVPDPREATVPDPREATVPDPRAASVPEPQEATVPDPREATAPDPQQAEQAVHPA